MVADALRITEVFFSLQGEARTVGIPTVFVRLTGCPLRCVYCDSEYAFHGGQRRSIDSLMQDVRDFKARHICVTGGEPLAQPAVLPFLTQLCDEGFTVSLETSGAMPINSVDARVNIVMDLKTPSSGELDKNLYANIALLKSQDQIKFVIANRQDYEWARFKLDEYGLPEKVSDVLFSPSFEELAGRELADWILADCLPVRFQIQLHKMLWGDVPGV